MKKKIKDNLMCKRNQFSIGNFRYGQVKELLLSELILGEIASPAVYDFVNSCYVSLLCDKDNIRCIWNFVGRCLIY